MPGMKSLTRPMLYRISIEHEMIEDGKYPNQSDFIKKPETSRPMISRDLDIKNTPKRIRISGKWS